MTPETNENPNTGQIGLILMPHNDIAKPPSGTRASGRRLWASIVTVYELEEHELALLREAVRTVDTLDRLDAVVRADGGMIDTPSGVKVHPGLVEARQLRIALARLLAALRLPDGEVGAESQGRRQRRAGARGVYGIRGAVS
jgi:hypothetical protein